MTPKYEAGKNVPGRWTGASESIKRIREGNLKGVTWAPWMFAGGASLVAGGALLAPFTLAGGLMAGGLGLSFITLAGLYKTWH
ncbi:MAG: hypothetical protein WC880_02020 [Candidatus Paceibacterota bacterium]